jgi:hypothetical protein
MDHKQYSTLLGPNLAKLSPGTHTTARPLLVALCAFITGCLHAKLV